MSPEELSAGLARAISRTGIARVGLGVLAGEPQRLTGGAVMESWLFRTSPPPTPSSKEEGAFVLRRAPSLAFMEGRPYGHSTEAALIEAARLAGVTAPERGAGGGGRARERVCDARFAGDG